MGMGMGMGMGEMSWTLPTSWTIEAASSWNNDYGPNNVKEHTGRPWHSRAPFPQHLTFDAGEVVVCNGIATAQPPSGWAGSAMSGYTLLWSNNGEDWSTVIEGEGRNLPAGERQEIEFPAVAARYWKLEIAGNHGYHQLVTTQYVEFRLATVPGDVESMYHFGEVAANSCPTQDVTEEDCLEAAHDILPDDVTQGRTRLVAGSWGWVPPGCSVQSHFTHGQAGDWAAHYNRNQNGRND